MRCINYPIGIALELVDFCVLQGIFNLLSPYHSPNLTVGFHEADAYTNKYVPDNRPTGELN